MSYNDMEMKLNYHKQRIIDGFIKKGISPDDALISEKLSSIDLGLSIFKHTTVPEGSAVNTKEYNEAFNEILQDLTFLYKLLYENTVKEYTMLKAFVDTHMLNLRDTVNMYKLKAEQETNSTVFGKTLLLKKNDIGIERTDTIATLDLGAVNVRKGSTIACIANISNIESNKVLFKLVPADEKDTITAAPYNFNSDTITIPGVINVKTYETIINENQIVNGPIEMNLGEVKPSINNKYVILGGKNKVSTKDVDQTTYQIILDRPLQTDMLYFDNRTYIDFYAIGANTITFKFNKKPINANFPLTDYKVTNLNHIHHFFMEVDKGFALNFELDGGDVYAVKDSGVINGSKLYYSNNEEIRDFHIEEYIAGDLAEYTASVVIQNDDGSPFEIESIIIKELNAIGGVQ